MSENNCHSGKMEYSYFAPGPAKMPNEVLEELKDDITEYEDTHVSILEISHRSQAYCKLNQEAQDLIRELLKVPDNYKILFLQGGAQCQLGVIPLNLISKTGKADYIVTGTWSSKAAKEGAKYGMVHLVLPEKEKQTSIPPPDQWQFSQDPSYIYFCANETIEGIEFHFDPNPPKGVPLICDMTSNIFSRPIDISKYGVIYGSSQKNMGCAGVTVVIVREDLIGHAHSMCPSVLDYAVQAKNNSIYNTPPTFSIYVLNKVMKWIKNNGGVEGMEKRSLSKSKALYNIIDSSGGFYSSPLEASCRSRMNVVFRIGSQAGDEDLEKKFLEEAAKEGLLSLKGHRWVGGIRASIYNAITLDDVQRLCTFMANFQTKYETSKKGK